MVTNKRLPLLRQQSWSLQRREALTGVLFALPAMLGFVLFAAGPMGASAIISLTDWGLLTSPHWVGLANYIGAVTPNHPIPGLIYDPFFWTSLRVTFYYTALTIPLVMVMSFILALMLSQPIRFVSLFRTVYYLPAILPAVSISIAWLWLLNPDFGLFNTLLDWAGLPTGTWITGESTVIPSLVLMNIWSCGGLMILFLAALKGVPRQLYEAAAIDGAGAIARLWHVTLPAVSPVILFNLVTAIIATFGGGGGAFIQASIITNGGPNNATLFYPLYLYRLAFQNGHMGYASALGWIMFLILLVITLVILRVARSRVYYEDAMAA